MAAREVRILDYLRTGSHRRQVWGEKLKFFGMLGKNESNHKKYDDTSKDRKLNHYEDSLKKKVTKGVRRMPWLSEAKKDVTSCDKLRGLANTN